MSLLKKTSLSLAVILSLCVSSDILEAKVPANGLTQAEQRSGWKLLFDGKSADQWRNYRKDTLGDGWEIKDGSIVRSSGGAGDIITKEQFQYFELSLQYRISKGGNSGIMFHVTEELDAPWQTGPEIQVQDNIDGHDPQKAGWLYQLYKPTKPDWAKMFEEQVGFKSPDTDDSTLPVGAWNHVYLRIGPKKSEVQMNGVSYFYFNVGDDDWNERVAKSKFAKYPQFGKAGKGHICLQDHGNEVAYRNIKIRAIPEDGSVKNPVDSELPLKSVEAFPQLTFEGFEGVDEDGRIQAIRPLEMIHAGDGTNRLFIAAQRGKVYVMDNDPQAKEAKVVLDITDRVQEFDAAPNVNEEGLLGFAIHPDFKENGKFVIYYSSSTEGRISYLSSFIVDHKTNKADPASEVKIMRIPQPFSNHNGGPMVFGNDGYLYLGLGDGGGRNDPTRQGQDLSTWMGSILRIDVDNRSDGKNYSIPKDNPFVDVEGAQPEIFAYGVRNPWRMSVDRKTGNIWFADVGQDMWEEVNIVKKGANYGWSMREGSYGFNNGHKPATTEATEPVWEYDHQIGKSITGGHIYRGKVIPELRGAYIYADFISGRVWALKYNAKKGVVTENIGLQNAGTPILSFGLAEDGEMYYTVESVTGKSIFKLVK